MPNEIPERLKILLYGPPGSGKTYFIGTAPTPIYVFDTDNGIETISQLPDDILDYDTYKPSKRDNLQPLNKLISKLNEFADECPYETVALDSATNLARLLQYRIITLNKNWNETNKMRIQDWGVLKDDLEEIFISIQSLDAHVVVTGHNRVVQPTDEDGNPQGETLYLCLSEAGQAYPQKAPADFDEIYKMDMINRPRSGTEYRVQTQADQKWLCKTRLNYYDREERTLEPILDQYEEPDFSHIIQKVKKARK